METRSRLAVVRTLCILALLPLALRLAWLQVVRHQQLELKAADETLGSELILVPRGRILDREGRVLAESVPVSSSFCDFTGVEEPARALRAAAKAAGVDAGPLLGKLRPGRRFLWLKRKMLPEEAARLRAFRLPWVGFVADEQRVYPNGEMLRAVIGSVDLDEKGLSGLELAYDRELSGRSYRVRTTKDRAGNAIVQEGPPDTARAPDLRLSIDRSVQHFAESAVREAVVARRAKRGTVVVQDPRTGDLLALASWPPDALKNHAVQDVYEPGSTFKLVALAAALDKGLFRPDDIVDCEGGRWEVAKGVTIKDHEPETRITLSQVLERSSNIGTAKVTLRVGAGSFHRFCRLFGFGYKTGLPLPGESAGLLPEPKEFTPVRLANAGFGQGVAVTPLQLAGAYSAIANDGELLAPRLLLALGEREAPGPVRLRQVASPEAVAAVRDMLEGVVLRGTGQSAQVPGFRTAGKTGTAQKIDPATGRYSPNDYVSSFIGYLPARDPKLTVLVVIDSPRVGYYGSEVAGPVFSRVAREVLAHRGIPPDVSLPLRIPSGPNAWRTAPQRPALPARPLAPGRVQAPGGKAASPALGRPSGA
ncbi:MAG: penicillin-binding protein 2 [Elusimicrobiota bacterium]